MCMPPGIFGFGRSLAAIVWLAGRGLRYILAGSC
jgi:hypothetical protein